MDITYHQFLVLASLNYWPEDGQPNENFIDFVVLSTEGDPRGDISETEAIAALDDCVVRGWVETRLVNEDPYLFPTTAGRLVFEENKDHWLQQVIEVKKLFARFDAEIIKAGFAKNRFEAWQLLFAAKQYIKLCKSRGMGDQDTLRFFTEALIAR